MRARTREVQIFNMSLIDILCGALGAFCFMMLVLLPYYKPPGKASDLYKQQAQTQDLLKEAEKFTGAETNPAQVLQMAEMLRRLEEQIKQLQGQLNQFAAQNQQLQTQNDDLTKTAQKQTQELNARKPFLVYAAANDATQAVEIYVQDDLVQGEKRNPAFNPAGPHQGRFWTGDIDLTVPGRGIALWSVRDSPANVHYKLYVKLGNDAPRRRQTGIFSAAYCSNFTLNFPEVTLSPQRFWTFIGTLTSDPQGNGTITFQEATQAERDAEWTKLSKGASPPPAQPTNTNEQVMPFSSPAGQRSPRAISPEEQERRRKLVEEYDKARNKAQEERQQPQPVAPSPSP